jgi:hypothetical protein
VVVVIVVVVVADVVVVVVATVVVVKVVVVRSIAECVVTWTKISSDWTVRMILDFVDVVIVVVVIVVVVIVVVVIVVVFNEIVNARIRVSSHLQNQNFQIQC